MPSPIIVRTLLACSLLLTFTPQGLCASPRPTPTSSSIAPSISSTASAPAADTSDTRPVDLYLNVPKLNVGRIELDVDNLQADINLAANVAGLVTINAGVTVSVQKVNITIEEVDAQLELVVRLNHLVDIVNRVFQSLDLNPLLISTLNNVTSILEPVVGAVDGLLGSVTQGTTTLSFLVDNLGNIVQQTLGANGSPVSSIVGNYLTNMTATGATETLQNGLIQKTFSYTPLNALVNIVFNTAGQVVQATVQKQNGDSSGGPSSPSTNSPAQASASISSNSGGRR